MICFNKYVPGCFMSINLDEVFMKHYNVEHLTINNQLNMCFRNKLIVQCDIQEHVDHITMTKSYKQETSFL